MFFLYALYPQNVSHSNHLINETADTVFITGSFSASEFSSLGRVYQQGDATSDCCIIKDSQIDHLYTNLPRIYIYGSQVLNIHFTGPHPIFQICIDQDSQYTEIFIPQNHSGGVQFFYLSS